MNLINRGYLLLVYKQPYLDWANQFNEVQFNEGELDPTVYLIEEEFIEEEFIIERLFKKIMQVEFLGVTDNEAVWPVLSRENFDSFFSIILGSSVIDTLKNPLSREQI